MNEVSIIVKWNLEGVHCWPNAPDDYAMLRSKHSHIFYFVCHISVTKSRQVEFLEARRTLMKAMTARYGPEPCDFGGMSCEDLARTLVGFVQSIYRCRTVVKVFEDRFVGAEVSSMDKG